MQVGIAGRVGIEGRPSALSEHWALCLKVVLLGPCVGSALSWLSLSYLSLTMASQRTKTRQHKAQARQPHKAQCSLKAEGLPAMPTCNAYLHCLPALPTCNAYLECLPRMPTCNAYLQWLKCRNDDARNAQYTYYHNILCT